MATSRLRTEIIRFGLLLTMTVALISVATRHGDHGSGRESLRTHQRGPSATPSSGGSSGPATTSQTPATQPSTTASDGSHGGSSGTGQTGGTGQSGTGQSGTGQSGGVATLPNTGNSTQTIELGALAMLFIAGGSLGVRISRPRRDIG